MFASPFMVGLGHRLRRMAKRSANAAGRDGYRIFTDLFDECVDAKDLQRLMPPLDPEGADAYRRACDIFERGLTDWKLAMQMAALDASSQIRRALPAGQPRPTVVALLIDHSGSMKGRKILLAAAAAEVAIDFLLPLGVAVEILGFTTVGWRGGQSRQAWIAAGRPAAPGRLCDLRHIVYGEAAGRLHGSLWPMFRPDLLAENVDGEALEWAASRLRERSEPRKIVIVVSDGAPADDSTLTENGADYLGRHLREVVPRLRASRKIEVAAVGIGDHVDHIYGTSPAIESPDDLGKALIQLLQRLLTGDPRAGPGGCS